MNAETIEYTWVKTVDADGRITKGSGGYIPFIFEGEYVYKYHRPSERIIKISQGEFKFYRVENGRSIYYYYDFGISGVIQPHWDYTRAIIVSSDKKTINQCIYDNSGNLKYTEVFKVPTVPNTSGFIE